MSSPNSYPSREPVKTPEEIEATAKSQWQCGARLEAMETVLGRYINASELPDNPDLASVFMISDPEEAYAGLLVVKTLEELAAERQ
ncbi:hypothetical protein BH09PAT4_BH09PAT4_08370 [soil metagenome]